MLDTLYESNLTSLPLLQRGKVRDIYAVGADHLLIVTTDRLSAFDVVHAGPDTRQGRGADGGVEFLVRLHPRHRSPITWPALTAGGGAARRRASAPRWRAAPAW